MTDSGNNLTDLDVARIVLKRLGLDPSTLVSTTVQDTTVPTFGAYIPTVAAAVSSGARQTYTPYWNRILTHWEHLRLNEPMPSDIKQLAEVVKQNVVVRRNARHGRGAVELFIAALRCIYQHAIDDGLIEEDQNPAAKVAKPPRLPSARYALPAERVAQINHTASTTGNDPELDALILRFHQETAARRGGALALRTPHDIDAEQCLVQLHEKGETARWQPVSPTLMTYLQAHAEQRNAPHGGQLFRYRNGKPLTGRRYDHLWTRLGRHLPWVAVQQVTIHWLRYTTLTWVERNFSYAIARAYAGHFDTNGNVGTTATYVRAGIHEVATALAALTGEPHPLARPDTPGGAPNFDVIDGAAKV
ncbi:tyrosine-type recombinase/integrase [Actinophytocola sp.]|uniref:tyrosine-type recombinase/integrase n=1 Tax=Actinophytocola sp. TaxID=1872138 RepID=UPI003899E99B